LTDEASRRLTGWFGKVAPGIKRDGTIVTEADLEVDQLIRHAVETTYPGHGLLTEESTQVFAGVSSTWVVDPLDGTNNFANGLNHWGVSLALLRDGSPELAVLDFPLLGQHFEAVRGHGAWLNGEPLRVPSPGELNANQFFIGDARGYRNLDVTVLFKARLLGSAAYDLAAVAAGVAVAAFETFPKIWDIAGAWLVIEESGALIAPLFQGPPVFPLQPGTDYLERVFPVLATANAEVWDMMKAGVQLKPGADRFAKRLRAQGWVVDN
jgi:myo-inositol-1(or 4)-monophosphatase